MVTEGKKEELLFEDTPCDYLGRMSQLQHLRKNRTFCDVVLNVGGAEIYAHRSILSCASPYFMELFTTDDETKTGSEDKIIYKLNGGFEKDSLERLVTYAYTGKLEVPSQLLKSVFIAANKLKMEGIAKACGEQLVSLLSPDTCLGVRALPTIAANTELVERVDNFIQEQSDVIQVTQDNLGIPKILLKVIHSNQDEASITPRALCSLTFDWVKKQILEAEFDVQMLTEKEHLLYLNLDNSLHDCLDIESGAANDTEIIQDYKKISRKMSNTVIKPMRRKSHTPQPAKPRMMLFSRSISDNDVEEAPQEVDWKIITFSPASENSFLAIVTLGGCVTVLSIQQHISPPSSTVTREENSRPNSVEREIDLYTLIPHMSTSKCACGTGSINGKLIVCGGYDREECLKEVEMYDPKRNMWSNLPSMRQSRGRFDLTVLDGKVYAVGGCNGSKELSSVEVFDFQSQTWKYVASLPFPRSNSGVCSLNSQVFCIGGWNGKTGMKRCDVYDPKTNTWKNIAPMLMGRYQAAVVAMKGKVYVVGGCDSWNCLTSLEVYDPQQDTWRQLAPMNTPRRGCGAAVINGKIYVMGGSDGTQSLCSTEIYDSDTNTWSAGSPMTSCRANVNSAVIGKRMYAIGGFSGKNFLNGIEFLDKDTNEWTIFTPKPESVIREESIEEKKQENCKETSNRVNDQSFLNGIQPLISTV